MIGDLLVLSHVYGGHFHWCSVFSLNPARIRKLLIIHSHWQAWIDGDKPIALIAMSGSNLASYWCWRKKLATEFVTCQLPLTSAATLYSQRIYVILTLVRLVLAWHLVKDFLKISSSDVDHLRLINMKQHSPQYTTDTVHIILLTLLITCSKLKCWTGFSHTVIFYDRP
jgi:hypothetical protein